MTGGAPDWWVIGNPENRRVRLFQAALQQAGLAPARCVSYQDFLDRGPAALEEIAPGSVVRLESPGECFPVEQRILALGGVAGAMALTEERGRIHHPGRWFAGFTRLMAGLRQALPQVRWFNHPDDIVTLFDKPRCKALRTSRIAQSGGFPPKSGAIKSPWRARAERTSAPCRWRFLATCRTRRAWAP